ncbi:hypothetical protein G4228_019087 [Cervus hanglu yarkandensis]|nr:hypothetical protein G4228_019087 [Cervus hanglu yarkandensis]
MAERAGGGTSLRGLRERMVAAANAIAEERRSQGSFSSVPSQPPNIKSPFKPANRETQLLEKERKSKIVYEKQMEEKQRKLREQKEKDEQRRISAEKKRNEMLEEEREKFKAVLHRTLERSSHINRPKRWSWEGCTTVNSQNKTVSKHSTSTEKLEQGTCGLHRQMSSTGLQNSVAKKTPEKRRSSSLTRRCSRLHSSTETEQVEEKRPGIHNIIQYVNMPLLRLSSDELKSPIVPRKSTAVMPFQEKVEIPSKASVGVAHKASVEVPPEESMKEHPAVNVEALAEESVKEHPKVSVETLLEASMKEHSEVNVEALLEESMKEHPVVNVEALAEVSMEAPPKVSVEVLPEVNMEGPSVNVETSPETSEDLSLEAHVDPSPEVSMDSSTDVSVNPSPEVSMDSSQEVSTEASSEASVDISPEASMETLPEESVETSPEESVEAFSEISMAALPEESVEVLSKDSTKGPSEASVEVSLETSPEVTVEISSKKSEMDEQPSNPITKKRIPPSQIPCYRWSSSPTRRWRPPSPISTRKMKDVAKKVDEGQEDKFSKFGDGQQPKEMKKRESQEQEDQKVELQAAETLSGDAYEEDEADDEDESESDNDSFDDMHPSATINGMDSSPKPKTHVKNVRHTSKFLDVTSSQIHKEETKAFLNTDMKTFRQKRVKDPLNQTKSTRSSTKRPTNRAAKTGKAETSSTMGPSKSSHSEVQKWVCDQIIDFSSETEQPVSSFPPESPEHQPRGSVTSCSSHQPPIDNKNRSESVPAPLGKAFSHFRFI